MKNRKTNFVIFSIGACGYGLIEILWRGSTHWSMLGAGGLSFLGLSNISKKMNHSSLLIKAFIGSSLITSIEFCFGVIFNVILKKNVWDYSYLPLNFKGQICALYSFFWMVLSIFCIPFAGLVNRRLQKRNSVL